MLCNRQLDYIEKFNSNKNESLPYKRSIVIPSIVVSLLIGNRGTNIKKLQTELGVKMHLLGDNFLDYPCGRTLEILGDSEDKVIKARKYIDEEYILKKWESMNIGQRVFAEVENEQSVIYKEILIPKILTTQSEEEMAKMQKNSGIIEYLYRDAKEDGKRIIILRGTSDAVNRAEKELERMTKNTPKRSYSVSSFGETILDTRPVAFNNYSKVLNPSTKPTQKAANSRPKNDSQRQSNKNLFAYSPPPLQPQDLSKLRINTKNSDKDISVSAFTSTTHPGKRHIISTHGDNEFMFDSGIDLTDSSHKNHRNSKLNDSKSFSTTSEEKYGSEIRELHSENEKLKRQITLKDRELVRLNSLRTCIGCNSEQRSVVFLPCAHFLLCLKCAERNKICKICNSPRSAIEVKYK